MPFQIPRYTLATTAIIASLMLLGAGCGPTSRPSSTDTSVDLQGGTNGELTAGTDLQIPADFPADFPRYPGGKTTFVFTENAGASGSLVQETSDSLAQAQARVEATMQAQGFTKDSGFASDNVAILSFSKGTVRYQINIAHQAEKTTIQSIRTQQ